MLKKVAWKFGQSEKKQYLCSRFRNERKWAIGGGETAEKCNAENQPLTKKSKKYWKKLLKNLVSPKKSSTFAADFATNEKWSEILVIFESLINQWCSTREQEIIVRVSEIRNAQLGNWKRVIRFLLYGSR